MIRLLFRGEHCQPSECPLRCGADLCLALVPSTWFESSWLGPHVELCDGIS